MAGQHDEITKQLINDQGFDHITTLGDFRNSYLNSKSELSSSYVDFLDSYVLLYNKEPSVEVSQHENKDTSPHHYFEFLAYFISTCSEDNILVSKQKTCDSPLLTHLRSAHWHRLYLDLGPHLFRFLLNKILLFKNARETYVQISGIPLSIYINNKRVALYQSSVAASVSVSRQELSSILSLDFYKSHAYYGRPVSYLKHILCPDYEATDMRLVAGKVLAKVFTNDVICDNVRFLAKLKQSRKTPLLQICWSMASSADSVNLRRELVKCFGQTRLTQKQPVPFHLVVKFCERILFQMLPSYAFGCRENWQAVMDTVRKYIRMRKKEGMSLRYLFGKIKLSKVYWLSSEWRPGSCSSAKRQKLSKSEFEIQQQILARFLTWMLGYLLPRLVRAAFYVTESSSNPNGCYYYLHDVWREAQSEAVDKYKEGLRAVPLAEVSTSNMCRVRVVPKKADQLSNCRVIMRLGTPAESEKPWTSINWTLRPVFHALRMSIRKHHIHGRAHVHSVAHMLERLAEFRRQQHKKPVYFVKLDAEKCFDLLNRDTALSIAADLLKDEKYWKYNYRQYEFGVARMNRQSSHKFYKGAWCDHFREIGSSHFQLHHLPTSFKLGVQILQQRQSLVDRHQLLDLLTQHLRNCQVDLSSQTKSEDDVYTLLRGIPQGSSLSTMLCNLVLDTMEKECIKYDPNRSILMRYVDDFLFLTTRKSDVELFLTQMSSDSAKYGVRVNMDKTQSNIAVGNKKTVEFLGVPLYAPHLEPSYYLPESQVTNNSTLIKGQKHALQDIVRRILFQVELKLHAKCIRKLYSKNKKLQRFVYSVCRDLAQRLLVLVKLAFGKVVKNMNPVLWHVYLCVRGQLRKVCGAIGPKSILWVCSCAFRNMFRQKNFTELADIVHLLHCLRKTNKDARLPYLNTEASAAPLIN